MKSIKHLIGVFSLAAIAMILPTSCMKDFLDIKRDKSQVIPVTLDDYSTILYHEKLNFGYPVLGEIASDDYYVTDQVWNGLTNPVQQNAYIWADDIFGERISDDWNNGYEKVLLVNFSIEGVNSISETPENKILRNTLIGTAHFYRGCILFKLAQVFCEQYNPENSNSQLGLPLRTSSNINKVYPRSTLSETYSQIIDDLQIAISLLPEEVFTNSRPSQSAALGMLANVYLQMQDYKKAYDIVGLAIALAPELLDYNDDIDASHNAPFPPVGISNKEIIHYTQMNHMTIMSSSRLTIDSLLYDSYHETDLRREAFFTVQNDRLTYKPLYSGLTSGFFDGITTAELLLIRAECAARVGNIAIAVSDLNTLLSKRFRHNEFEPINESISAKSLLNIVLNERRKELVFRGRRWLDLRRFNQDPDLAKPLVRILNGKAYTLPVNSPKWVFPIPPDAINLGGLVQNER